jgi:hypothetical protein
MICEEVGIQIGSQKIFFAFWFVMSSIRIVSFCNQCFLCRMSFAQCIFYFLTYAHHVHHIFCVKERKLKYFLKKVVSIVATFFIVYKSFMYMGYIWCNKALNILYYYMENSAIFFIIKIHPLEGNICSIHNSSTILSLFSSNSLLPSSLVRR